MTQGRLNAASIVVGIRLWVLGGTSYNNASTTSEYVSIIDGINSEVGPDLPKSFLSFHAVVSLNETTAMLIGGRQDDSIYSRTTYYYSHFTQHWTPGPNLLQMANGKWQMIYPQAGIITDQITMEEHVVVFGYYLTLQFWTNPYEIK